MIIGSVAEITFCTITFNATNGIDSQGDILVQSGGSLSMEAEVNADDKLNDVRIIANGDIHQTTDGNIFADQLGVRQQASLLAASADLDANARFDVLLDDDNDVNQVAVENDFDGGAITFNDINELTVEEVEAATSGNVAFTNTVGIANTFSGGPTTGASDVDDGDVLINADGFVRIDRAIDAGDADVRIVGAGDISQDDVNGIITANELGVLQTGLAIDGGNDTDASGAFDIHLCAPNLVDVFAAENVFAGGEIEFNNAQGFTVGTVVAQTIEGVSFAGATGVLTNDGEAFLNSDGFLDIQADITVGIADLRIVANGDIHQLNTTTITADELGIRQEDGTLLATDDLDTNSRFDVILDGTNDVNQIAVLNRFDGGVVVFNDVDDLTVEEVTALTSGAKSFSATAGIVTTFSGVATTGPGDVDDGDILVNAGGFLDIVRPIDAGDADVRLIANGDIQQDAVGTITANELGVTQAGIAIDGNDLDANGTYDIHLCFTNTVDVLGTSNAFAGGEVSFSNTQALIVGTIEAQTIDGVTFSGETGLISNDGDVFVNSAGSLLIDQALTAGTANARLIVAGDLLQNATGIITANLLGVRQEETVFNASNDLDGNTRYDVILDDANVVNTLAGLNLFDGGVFAFNNATQLVIDSIDAATQCDKTFTATDGITTTFSGAAVQGVGDGDQGDILVNADGSLLINQTLNAANENADVRLVADGDLHQVATGIILADELGARIESNTLDAGDDIDSNGQYDIFLCFDNQVSFVAADNQFATGDIFVRKRVGVLDHRRIGSDF